MREEPRWGISFRLRLLIQLVELTYRLVATELDVLVHVFRHPPQTRSVVRSSFSLHKGFDLVPQAFYDRGDQGLQERIEQIRLFLIFE